MTGWDIEIRVTDIRGRCTFGHYGNEKIYYNGKNFKGKVCPTALAALMPTLYAFVWGAEFPWDKNKDVTGFTCPDRKNAVRFELRRRKDKPWTKGVVKDNF